MELFSVVVRVGAVRTYVSFVPFRTLFVNGKLLTSDDMETDYCFYPLAWCRKSEIREVAVRDCTRGTTLSVYPIHRLPKHKQAHANSGIQVRGNS